ncbi:hypothetical protein QA860_08450 [Streptomyces stelliscabiei]
MNTAIAITAIIAAVVVVSIIANTERDIATSKQHRTRDRAQTNNKENEA